MRRSEREITDRNAIDSIIKQCQVVRLGLSDNGQPYIVPLSFGYDGTRIYIHAALTGRKADILAVNNRVCFEFDRMLGVVTNADHACNWSMNYESVIGFGVAELVDEGSAKVIALNCIMHQYSNREWTFTEQSMIATAVYCIRIDEIAGKARS
jgi:nitroimidazol reductase NimA-like FMN-containing flavoprotein (pyridoxamine 5'-phosphate oxidase superfamily)